MDNLIAMRRHAAAGPSTSPLPLLSIVESPSQPRSGMLSRAESLHLFGRDDCVSCSSTPSCNCAADENCVLTSRTCSQCPTIQCIKNSSSGSSSINPGVIAGPVVAVLVIASLGLFWWLRRKKRRDLERLEELAARARKAESAGFQLSQPGSPAPHSARSKSNRSSQLPVPPPSATRRSSSLPPVPVDAEYRDENGAVIRVYSGKRGRINADPNHPDNGGPGDPFADRHSMSTGRTGDSEGSAHVIPIHFVPASRSNDSLSSVLARQQAEQSAAARTLDEARQNLWKPKNVPPPRPARLPDLDLRLNPPHADGTNDEVSGPSGGGNVRDSFVSGTSGAPSFLSGAPSYLSGASYDIHLDAPRIVTSKQVMVGRLQTAEMVQFGNRGIEHLGSNAGGSLAGGTNSAGQSPAASVRSNPFSERNGEHTPSPTESRGFLLPSPSSQQTFGTYHSAHSGVSDRTGQASGAPSVRTLTPNSRRFEEGEFDDGDGMSDSAAMHEPSPTDLRFSMGSLAFDRNSTSTMGTAFQYRPDSHYHHPMPRSPGLANGGNNNNGAGGVPPPRTADRAKFIPNSNSYNQHLSQPHSHRESMSSYKSFGADSLLGAFPMIPPGAGGVPSMPSMPTLPQSMSSSTLGGGHYVTNNNNGGSHPPVPATPSRPPVAFRTPAGNGNGNGTRTRPTTAASAHSIADSVLGAFPFVPPNQADLDGLPSAPLPTASVPDTVTARGTVVAPPVPAAGGAVAKGTNKEVAEGGEVVPRPGRLTLGMSTMSEGLGDFEFSFDRGTQPPMPGAPGA